MSGRQPQVTSHQSQATVIDDDAFVAGFEACVTPNAGFHHADHVRVAWVYLGRLPLLAAADTFAANLKRFATAHGKPQL